MPPVKKVPATPEQKIKRAKTVATKAINDAAVLVSDRSRSRSTTTRAAFKLKAEALEQVALILAGKA
jgi:hypothetical protein